MLVFQGPKDRGKKIKKKTRYWFEKGWVVGGCTTTTIGHQQSRKNCSKTFKSWGILGWICFSWILFAEKQKMTFELSEITRNNNFFLKFGLISKNFKVLPNKIEMSNDNLFTSVSKPLFPYMINEWKNIRSSFFFLSYRPFYSLQIVLRLA